MISMIASKSRVRLQSGFTLIELIVALAITSVILSIIVGSLYQVMFRQSDVKDSTKVMLSLQDAGHWISRDVMNSQSVDTSVPQRLKLAYTVQWPTSESYQYVYLYDVTYNYTGGEIRRSELLTTKKYDSTSGALVSTTESSYQTLIAGNITAFQAAWANGAVQVSVTASLGKYTEMRDYSFIPRIS